MRIQDNYTRRVTLVKVHDGDTITVQMDLGYRMLVTLTLRLYRIDAPEMTTPEGKQAKSYLQSLLPKEFYVRTFKDPGEKYGRWLAEIFVKDVNINDALVAAGHARFYDGGKR